MKCSVLKLPDGTTAIVCGSRPRQRRCACGAPAPFLCDWKLTDAVGTASTNATVSGTCDRPLCERCTTKPMPGMDLCPEHAWLWRDHHPFRP